MWRSVPQMAVFSRRIRTSFGPGSGTGTSSIQMPLASSRLTSAFMVVGIVDCWGCDMVGPVRWFETAIVLPWECAPRGRSEEHTSELQSRENLVCRLLLEKKKNHTPNH